MHEDIDEDELDAPDEADRLKCEREEQLNRDAEAREERT